MRNIHMYKDMFVSIESMKCILGKIGQSYSFKKKLERWHGNKPLSESSLNKVMEAIMAGENDPSIQDPVHNTTEEDGVMELFHQFYELMPPMLDWPEQDTIVISKVSLQGKSATSQATIQNIVTTALLDTGANISVVPERFFRSLPQIFQLSKIHTHKFTLASGANLGPLGQCDVKFLLGNKQFTHKFIALQDFVEILF